MPKPRVKPLLTARSALILLLSLIVAACAAELTYWSSASLPDALLAGGAALGGAVALFHSIIE